MSVFILSLLLPALALAADLRLECIVDQDAILQHRLQTLKTKYLSIAKKKPEALGRYFEEIFQLSVENWIQLGTSIRMTYSVNLEKKTATLVQQNKDYTFFTPYTYSVTNCESCKAEGDRFAQAFEALPNWKKFDGLENSKDLVEIEKAARELIAQVRPIARDLKLTLKSTTFTDKRARVSRLAPLAKSEKRSKAEADRLIKTTAFHVASKVESITLSKDSKSAVITTNDENEGAPMKCRVLGAQR